VALHELGHNLGLEHSNVRSSIMFPYLLHGNNGLENDDIAGIQALYGRPQIKPSTSTPPTPPSGNTV
jgi:predicted Zn-dependent protease